MVFDFHTHFYTSAYLDEIEQGGYQAVMVRDAAGNRLLKLDGDYSMIAPGHFDADRVIEHMDRHGVDRQLLSFSIPGLHVEEPDAGRRLARIVNEALAETVARHPGRLSALAVLPLQDPAASAAELLRTAESLNLRGGMLFSNINGLSLGAHEFQELYEAASSLDLPLFVHPTTPHAHDVYAAYRLTPMAGFPFDTSVAALHLVFSGTMAAFPDLKVVLGNLGGTIPFLAGRIDQAYRSYPEAREKLDRPPSEYLKRMYYESAGMPDSGALRLTIDFAGIDRVMFGSDFPQQIADVGLGLRTIDELGLDEAARRRIVGRNAAGLLKE
ncbi:MAG: amidohydrolase [Gemmatimonadetes bacterium]|nr:amidohydrolase [Gemmatimonadota bacterium]MYG84907.1 amidohydrolase [Gemmatimonadota bacterium]MYJ89096.1 amidohydrolase [Gemmatimonadota bacterium]